MEDRIITYKTAKLAKECGYKNPRLASGYGDNGEHGKMGYIKAPTQSLLQKWLRETHNIHVNVHICKVNGYIYNYMIFEHPELDFGSHDFTSYEDALAIWELQIFTK